MFKILVVGLCLSSVLMLAGCGGGGGGTSALGNSEFAGGQEVVPPQDPQDPQDPQVPQDPVIPQGHNPEPATLLMLGLGLSGLVASRVRNQKKH